MWIDQYWILNIGALYVILLLPCLLLLSLLLFVFFCIFTFFLCYFMYIAVTQLSTLVLVRKRNAPYGVETVVGLALKMIVVLGADTHG